jgi:hypothetical protein
MIHRQMHMWSLNKNILINFIVWAKNPKNVTKIVAKCHKKCKKCDAKYRFVNSKVFM